MPEFEENKPKPDLNKDNLQYQPGQGTSDQQSSHQNTQNPAHSSNMRGRWKRSSRGPTKPISAAKEDHVAKEEHFIKEDRTAKQDRQYIHTEMDESPEDEEEFFHEGEEEQEERVIPTRHERTPRPQHQKHTHTSSHATSNKPINRKDIFIPKTKQESERHKTRYPAMGQKQPSIWRKILAFFGLIPGPKKHSRKHREDHQGERPHSGSYQKKRYSQPRKHPAPRPHSSKNQGKQGPKSGF